MQAVSAIRAVRMAPQPDHFHKLDGRLIPIAPNPDPPVNGPTCSDVEILAPPGPGVATGFKRKRGVWWWIYREEKGR